jgi:2-hydroxy-6-oxonona-2,4-dienedioate hydrolase
LSTVEIDGGLVAYEVLGDGPPIVITPGGRFSMRFPGYRELAEAVATEMKVLIWDRPGCGDSDLNFTGETESDMRADVLAQLLRHLDMAPAVIAGGSGGARDSLVTVLRHPEVASALIGWNFVGGVVGTMGLASVYCLPYINTANTGGMEAVADMRTWNDLGLVGDPETKPRYRERLLAMDPDDFMKDMNRWLRVYIPEKDKPIPGVPSSDIARISVPTLIFLGGTRDLSHPDYVSRQVHELIPSSELVLPPWEDNEWNRLTAMGMEGGRSHLFDSWYQLAPQIIEFCQRVATS